MSFLRAFQWYRSHADPIWPDGTFKFIISVICKKNQSSQCKKREDCEIKYHVKVVNESIRISIENYEHLKNIFSC